MQAGLRLVPVMHNSGVNLQQPLTRMALAPATSGRRHAARVMLALGTASLSLWGTAAQALGPNLVLNPSFENNTGTQFVGTGFWPLMSGQGQTPANFPNWTVTAPSYQAIAVIGDNNNPLGGNSWASLAAWPAPQTSSGQYYFQADGDYTSGVEAMISQAITGLTVGASYQLSFDWGAGVCTVVPPCDASPPNSGWDISFGLDTDAVNSGPLSPQSFSGWQTYSKVFTATAMTQTLSFLSKGGPTGVPPMSLLDNVSVAEVPRVPGPLGILGVATALGCSRHLRRRLRRS